VVEDRGPVVRVESISYLLGVRRTERMGIGVLMVKMVDRVNPVIKEV
jgi:hypothetical protein